MVAETHTLLPENPVADGRKELLSKSELSIWLDNYDDIFSDFDSRPYSERALSDDFLNEARKMAKEKPTGKIELKLLMPEQLRNKEAESIIIKSLHRHFRYTTDAIKTDKKQIERKGILSAVSGVVLMVIAAFVKNLPEKNFLLNTILIILEPAGWFLLWTGLDFFVYRSNKRKPELNFNTKMAHSEITFLSF